MRVAPVLRCNTAPLYCSEARIVHAASVEAIDSQRIKARAVVAAVVACASETNSLLGMGTGPADTVARRLAEAGLGQAGQVPYGRPQSSGGPFWF